MAAVTASVVSNLSNPKKGGGSFMDKMKEKIQAKKNFVPMHGDDRHSGGSGTGGDDLASADAPELEGSSVAFKSSPAKIKNVGYNNPSYKQKSATPYTPFKMLGHEHPGPNQRTPATLKAFGVKDSDGVDKISTTPGQYSSSPNKFGAFGGLGRWGRDMVEKMRAKKAANAANVGGGGGSEVPPHTHDSSEISGGGGGGGDLTASVGGGGGGGGVWNVGNAISEMEGMDKTGRKEYMGGLDASQQKRVKQQQLRDRMSGPGGIMGSFSNMFSDIRLKENIERTGESLSGIPIYEFNYIGSSARYSGVMAQDLLGTDSVLLHESGFYTVDYSNIDVVMKLL